MLDKFKEKWYTDLMLNDHSKLRTYTGLDINVCPIPVKTDVGQVDLVLRLSKFKLVFCAKYDRGLDLGFWEMLKPWKWTNITSFFLIWLKRSTKIFISL